MVFADVTDWLLDEKVLPAAVIVTIVVAWAVVKFIVPLLAQLFASRPTSSSEVRAAHSRDAKVQQTTVGDVKAKGDVEINPRQR